MGPKGEVRPLFLMMIYWVLSFGIYGMWWSFKVSSEVNAFLGKDRLSAIKVWLLTAVTCGLYGLYFQFIEAKNILREVQQKAGVPQKVPFLIGPMQFQGTLNKVWEGMP